MEARYLVILLLLPFVGVFVYATWSEYKRYKRDGRSEYGLTYDPDTNTTHVGTIAEDEESYDPEDYIPDDSQADETAENDPSDPEDQNEQDTRT